MRNHYITGLLLFTIASAIDAHAGAQSDDTPSDNVPNKDFDFSFAPDGQKAVFYTYRNEKLPDIFERDHSGKERNLTKRENTWDIEPSFSPDGKQIIYSSGSDMASLSLRIMNADGSDDRVFYDGDDNEVAASWSPDGSLIMFSAFNNNERTNKIYAADRHGNNVRVLTDDLPGQSSNASWSPDGKHILFANRPNENMPRDIYVMNADGKDRKRLTHDTISQMSPIYTPDSTVIIFAGHTDDGHSQLYTIPAGGLKEGEQPTQVTDIANTQHYFLTLKPGNHEIALSQGDWTTGFTLVTIPLVKFNIHH